MPSLKDSLPATPRDWGTSFITVVVVLGFLGIAGWIIANDGADKPTSQLIIGALIASFSGVINFYVGTTKGSSAKNDTINQQNDLVRMALQATPPPAPAPAPQSPASAPAAS